KLMNPQTEHGEKCYVVHAIIKGKAVIITGGDSGISKAIAIAMAREGADILIAYKDNIENEDAYDTAEWVKQAGSKAILFKADLSEELNCKKLIELAVTEFKKIDVLINNAAYQMTYKD